MLKLDFFANLSGIFLTSIFGSWPASNRGNFKFFAQRVGTEYSCRQHKEWRSYTPEFKDETVKQFIDLGHTIAEVSERLGLSSHSLYKWLNAVKSTETELQRNELLKAKSEILKLRSQLRRTEVERDILRNCPPSARIRPHMFINTLAS
ncbi:transposase [Coleofasciculus sp. LEGE 07081]|nr:transposase [Coleofasciculus sp. LEGE 07081]